MQEMQVFMTLEKKYGAVPDFDSRFSLVLSLQSSNLY